MEKTLSFDTGFITYRLPNVPQTLRLIAKLGLTDKGMPEHKSMYELTADFIEIVEPYISEVLLEKDGLEITEWSKALEHMEIIEPCGQLMAEFLSALQGGKEAEKKS